MTARQAAARALMQIFDHGAYSNLALPPLLADLPERERAFASALTLGVLERAVTLDHILGTYGKTPVRKLQSPVLQALRCGVYQLVYMPSVPESAAVSQAVETVRALGAGGASGYVNGLLRAFVRAGKSWPEPKDPRTALSVRCGVPAALAGLLRRSYGHERAVAALEALSQKAPLFVRVNTCRISREALLERLEQEGIQALPDAAAPGAVRILSGGSPASGNCFAAGLFHIQDLSSQLCAEFLEVAPGMRLLDLCAAPGGKTFTLAEQMEDRGEILACDLYPSRLSLVESGAVRLGLSSIRVRAADARVYDPALGRFDRVLCDVVCSGFGVIRRKPEIRYKDPNTLADLPAEQYNILCTASNYLKKGGKLVYSTCTLNPTENEDVVRRFLAAHPGFSLYAPMRTLLPCADYDGDGFFMARLKAGGGEA